MRRLRPLGQPNVLHNKGDENLYHVANAMTTRIHLHKNALNAIYRPAAHGTLVDAQRARAAYAHVKAWNDGVVLGVGVANATRVQYKTDRGLFRSLHVAANVYAVEMRTRTSRRLWT